MSGFGFGTLWVFKNNLMGILKINFFRFSFSDEFLVNLFRSKVRASEVNLQSCGGASENGIRCNFLL